MTDENKNRNKEIEKQIEYHLKRYRTYASAIKNLENELEYILPGITANYEYKEGAAGTFTITSKTEQAVLDRLESAKAVHINEQKRRMELIVKAIDTACESLNEEERDFVRKRYFEGESYLKVSEDLKCSQSYVFTVRKDVMGKLKISLMHIVE